MKLYVLQADCKSFEEAAQRAIQYDSITKAEQQRTKTKSENVIRPTDLESEGDVKIHKSIVDNRLEQEAKELRQHLEELKVLLKQNTADKQRFTGRCYSCRMRGQMSRECKERRRRNQFKQYSSVAEN